jgi:hypothetical protein
VLVVEQLEREGKARVFGWRVGRLDADWAASPVGERMATAFWWSLDGLMRFGRERVEVRMELGRRLRHQGLLSPFDIRVHESAHVPMLSQNNCYTLPTQSTRQSRSSHT